MKGGKPTGKLALRIHVIQKLPPSLVPPDFLYPSEFHGLPTDIVESPLPFRQAALAKPLPQREGMPPCSDNAAFRQRPLIAGISMANVKVTGGTLGCFCKSTRPEEAGQRFALTTGHVLGSIEGGQIGDLVLQPAIGDVGSEADGIGKVARLIPIERGRHAKNVADAGIARIDADVEIDNSICAIGAIAGIMTPAPGMQVIKHGRTTQRTEGIISDFPIHTVVTLKHSDLTLVARFNNQMRIESADKLAFAEGGDSGSLIIDKETRNAVGLFFAAPDTGSFAFANPIGEVFRLLDIDLL